MIATGWVVLKFVISNISEQRSQIPPITIAHIR
ncbi:hypothetical protein RO3G_07312 [Rhizopus delemar RA 99-880]|uniref:Uncharacterized protein n=1 Tax=Rhizopus delemar (strain RA 99-880 / ATCC MYA-4621 / FGSC 9543 / NRRL 43880) TaxID=246409 RepID=I1C2C7_RHIO9|nr:hypothetical protein RO3G_07312 [Rhizopus delemar RA 99-880]|eukprot:EIE82607.1 hypothetical protein RO3G_07312 [Rhizopus delemar RA 99-880]